MWVLMAQAKRTLGQLSQPIGALGLIPGAFVVRGYICQTHGTQMGTCGANTVPGSVPWMRLVESARESLGLFIMMSRAIQNIRYHSSLMRSSQCPDGRSSVIRRPRLQQRTGATFKQLTGAAIRQNQIMLRVIIG